jgi:hypothetical protein
MRDCCNSPLVIKKEVIRACRPDNKKPTNATNSEDYFLLKIHTLIFQFALGSPPWQTSPYEII